MLNYNHLHYFHMTATEGSVAAAADRLGVTQPTVSEQVRALEKTLGVSLFERTTGGLKLTDAGRLAFEHTSVMFRAGERLVESLVPSEQTIARTLRVGLTGSVARSTSTDFLMPLLALENCVPTIRLGDPAELIRDLRSNELDLVLGESEPADVTRPGLEVAKIATTSLLAVAPPTVEPNADWSNMGLLQYRASSAYRWDVEAFLETNGYHPRTAAEVDDSMFLVEAAARGGYVAFVPRSIVRDAITAGRLRVLAQLQPSRSGVYALYHDGVTADLARIAVTALIDYAKTATL